VVDKAFCKLQNSCLSVLNEMLSIMKQHGTIAANMLSLEMEKKVSELRNESTHISVNCCIQGKHMHAT